MYVFNLLWSVFKGCFITFERTLYNCTVPFLPFRMLCYIVAIHFTFQFHDTLLFCSNDLNIFEGDLKVRGGGSLVFIHLLSFLLSLIPLCRFRFLSAVSFLKSKYFFPLALRPSLPVSPTFFPPLEHLLLYS